MAKKYYPLGPRLVVTVDAETIENSVARDSSHCMIAESIKKCFPGASKIAIDLQTVRFSDLARGLRYTYLTPRAAQVQLIRFDQGKPPEPFTVVLKNAHVTKAGSNARSVETRRKDTRRQREKRQRLRAAVNTPTTAFRTGETNGKVAVPIGGQTPPLQQTTDKVSGKDVPFSRRRAFGLRALEY